MKITTETSLVNFETWCGATDTKQTIIANNKVKEFDSLIEELYPEGLTEIQLNDILRFESEWIFEVLGISEEEGSEY